MTEAFQFNSQAEAQYVFSQMSRSDLRPMQPPVQWVMGVLYVGLKWLGNKADHTLSTSSAQVKNEQNYLYSPIHLCGMHRSFTVTFNNMEFFNGTTPRTVNLAKSCTLTSTLLRFKLCNPPAPYISDHTLQSNYNFT